jgi:hypothetical protein
VPAEGSFQVVLLSGMPFCAVHPVGLGGTFGPFNRTVRAPNEEALLTWTSSAPAVILSRAIALTKK